MTAEAAVTTAKPKPPGRVARLARLRWVKVGDMHVSSVAQRDRKEYRVNQIVAEYDEDKIGNPVLSLRDGLYYIVDGQHRMEATSQVRGEGVEVQCWVYEGLTETDEAELFLRLNDVLIVHAFDKFRVSVQAGRDTETDINRIVRAQGLVISRDRIPGAIRAVGTLTKAYQRDGAKAMARALTIIRDAYGDSGFEAPVIDGISLLCSRYEGDLDTAVATQRLGKVNGGVNGLLGKAEILRRQTGNTKSHCVAAAAIDVINSGRGGKKLASWWKDAKN